MADGQRPKVRTSYKRQRTIEPLHTSGSVTITLDGSKLVTCLGEEALLTELSSGRLLSRFSCASESITALCLSPSASHLVLFTTPSSLQVYEVPAVFSSQVVQPFRVIARAHDAPVHVCTVDPTSSFLASGSADGIVKVWDISAGHVTHVFKGHGGVVSALKFNFPRDPSIVSSRKTFQLVTASVDTVIRVFDLMATTRNEQGALRPIALLEGHVSVPRGLDVTPDGKWLISGGRDSVVLLWDMLASSWFNQWKEKKGKFGRPNPDPFQDHPCHGKGRSRRGVVRIWDLDQGSVIYSLATEAGTSSVDQEEQRQIIDAFYLPTSDTIVSAHADQNIFFYSLKSRSLVRHMIGYNDEIVDAIFLSPPSSSPGPSSNSGLRDTQLALATNSSLIRIYSVSNLDAQVLAGHSEIVLSLDQGLGGRIFASGSKDKSARIWAFSQQSDASGWGCIAVCEGHAGSVGSITMSRVYDDADSHPRFVFTGSQDRTIKMWDLSELPLTFTGADPEKCHSLTTHKAHDKDINSLDVAPNDQLLASGSQDRTANVYEVTHTVGSRGKPPRGEIKRIGCCKGHKRGVWNVRFGRTERVLATGSSDKTVKLWSLEDFTCVKTFEGHTNSVLRVDFINHGMHLVSAGSDGLVKLWSVKEETCMTTLDNHEDKVWALAISSDEATIVSGAADSVVTFWQDCTEEGERERETKRANQVLREQDFMNYLAVHDYRRAIELALAMQQPGRLLALFGDIRSAALEQGLQNGVSVSGSQALDEVLRTLPSSDLSLLVRYIRDWNTNAKTSGVAQSVLYAILKLRPAGDVTDAFGYIAPQETGEASQDMRQLNGAGSSSLKDIVDGLIPYTQRHLARLDRLVQESFVVDYILNEMDDGMFDGTDRETMDVDIPS
ncbi:U3 small nucleolar RNA-associated protein [Chiua virens]|nr:U3 small nucleolar RNA-associated protein [Chiua virens]